LIDDIREKFLPRFLASARERLARAARLVAEGDTAAPSIASDLHTIAGEASIMGLHEIAAMARDAERAARVVGGIDDAHILVAVDRLARQLDELAPVRRS